MGIDAARRAKRAWKRIERWPLDVVFTRPRVVQGDGTVTPEANLAAQTVRVESDNRATVVIGDAGTAPTRKLVVYGIQDHPTLPATDMEEGYRFYHDNDQYVCIDVLSLPGERQGIFQAVG
jgi:hypothetical protein